MKTRRLPVLIAALTSGAVPAACSGGTKAGSEGSGADQYQQQIRT
ncbi:hypothetical protein [Streptomyces sp. GESEQ-35]|nr:hypothetical protein [Streptomyces sp. GESEQ-35]